MAASLRRFAQSLVSRTAKIRSQAEVNRRRMRSPRFIRPALERLENRTVPTILFHSALGGDTIAWGAGNMAGEPANQVVNGPISNNPAALSSPLVYLIFWG